MQNEHFDSQDKKSSAWKIILPFQCQILGPSDSGKSYLLLELIKNSHKIFEKDIKNIAYVAPQANTTDTEFVRTLSSICKETGKRVAIFDAPPKVKELREIYPSGSICLILDDLTCFEHYPQNLAELSSVHSHHNNISVFYILQNCFQETSKLDLRTINRNLNVRILLYQRNDYRLFSTLNSILFPDRKKFLIECLEKAKSSGHPYIVVNVHPRCPLERRYICFTDIFNTRGPCFFDLYGHDNSDNSGSLDDMRAIDLSISPQEIEQSIHFLSKCASAKTLKEFKKTVDGGEKNDLSIAFKMLVFVVYGKVGGLKETDVSCLKKKRKTILQYVRSASLVNRTLRSKDLLRTVLKAVGTVICVIISLFIVEK